MVNNTLVVNHNNIVVNYESNGFTMARMNMHVPPPKHRAVSWRFILYYIYIYVSSQIIATSRNLTPNVAEEVKSFILGKSKLMNYYNLAVREVLGSKVSN